MPILWITSFVDNFAAPSLAYNEVRYSLMGFQLAELAITDLGHAPCKRPGTACDYRDTPQADRYNQFRTYCVLCAHDSNTKTNKSTSFHHIR